MGGWGISRSPTWTKSHGFARNSRRSWRSAASSPTSRRRPTPTAITSGITATMTTENPGGAWDREADVVIVGSGATGLPAAIAAVEGGASVILVEANYDIGGHAAIS